MIYVYTSILNGWDNLRTLAVPPDPNVEYICFTNVPNLPAVTPWRFRPLYPVGEACRTARVPKILPHLMLPKDAEYSIYVDGNLQLKKQPAEIIYETMRSHDWAAHRHPCRTCVYEEAEHILTHPGMDNWRAQDRSRFPRISKEIVRYREAGFPEGAGLWANGMIVRRHSPHVEALNERWWKLYLQGGERDQLSFPIARDAEGLPVYSIPGVISADSPYVSFYYHAAWADNPRSRDYHAERDQIREGLGRIRALTLSDGGLRYPDF